LDKHLHIICLDVPYPVDYGGVFDLFYKLPALKDQGIKIHLHCFEYGRGEQPELNVHCESVRYYDRLKGHQGFSTSFPYIVATRTSDELLENLLKNDYPILMEGVHCTYLLNDERFKERKCFVRLHNVEHIYYRHLYETTSSITKKAYYWWESKLLLQYEKHIADKATFWAVSKKDAADYRSLGCDNIDFLPLFLPPWKVNGAEGKGTFCLYHGHLAVAENEKAAAWLLQKVFDKLEIPFVVAGKNPSRRLKAMAENKPHTCLVENPSEAEMQDLVAKAHIHVLPSFNATGIKLKLVNALYNGRHCVVNDAAVEGSGLEGACHIGTNAEAFRSIIVQLYNQPFAEEELKLRHRLLDHMFDNAANAQQMVKWIWREG
jgi:hypothetical protein